MLKIFTTFNEMTNSAGNYLEQELGYATKSSYAYKRVWQRVMEFMFANGITHYDISVEKQFLISKFQNKVKQDLTVNERITYNGVKMLTEFKLTGKINVPVLPSKYPLDFTGAFGKVVLAFLNDKQQTNPSRSTVQCYQRNLFELMKYCENLYRVEDLDLTILLGFLNQCTSINKTDIRYTITIVRAFMKYLYNQKIISIDYSEKIPRYKTILQPKIPSTYSKDEIEKLIASIDRTNTTGKRNYVIILIAARLGLRASDISRLKFEHLNWNTNTIELTQYKTGKQIVLPILPDVGNAIIDYLKHGRPDSKEPYVLLTATPPYGRFTTSNVVTHVVQRAMIKAGINIKNRRFGSHSLRHSLSCRMLEKSTSLPVISEVLGHQNSESTKYYLRVDLTSMQQCMLDVPEVSINFYLQRGGKFYE